MNRIMIVGGAGSGKSTLAQQMGQRCGLPVYHLDQVFWMPNWMQRPEAEKLALTNEIELREAWVIEGGISATFPNRIARCDMLIWLDLPITVRLWRVMRRTLRYLGRARPDMPQGCVQMLDANTTSFLRFIWQDRHAGRQRVASAIDAYGKRTVVKHLRDTREVRAFLAGLKPS